MRNVINLNENWAFIQENAGLPKEMPSDWQRIGPSAHMECGGRNMMGMAATTEELTGMQRRLRRQSSHLEMEKSM